MKAFQHHRGWGVVVLPVKLSKCTGVSGAALRLYIELAAASNGAGEVSLEKKEDSLEELVAMGMVTTSEARVILTPDSEWSKKATGEPRRRRDIDDTGPSADPEKRELNPSEIKELWRKFCPELPDIKEVTAPRLRMARARDREGGGLSALFEEAGKSTFIKSGAGKWANFDWVVKPQNATKIMEGRYKNEDAKKIDTINNTF